MVLCKKVLWCPSARLPLWVWIQARSSACCSEEKCSKCSVRACSSEMPNFGACNLLILYATVGWKCCSGGGLCRSCPDMSNHACCPSEWSTASTRLAIRLHHRLKQALLRNAAHEEAVGEDVFIALQRSSGSAALALHGSTPGAAMQAASGNTTQVGTKIAWDLELTKLSNANPSRRSAILAHVPMSGRKQIAEHLREHVGEELGRED